MSDMDRTHWGNCWRDRDHHACAVSYIEALELAREYLQKAVLRLEKERGDLEVERNRALQRAWQAEMERDQKWALRREIEALLGVESGPASEEQFARGIDALRALIAERDALREALEARRESED